MVGNKEGIIFTENLFERNGEQFEISTFVCKNPDQATNAELEEASRRYTDQVRINESEMRKQREKRSWLKGILTAISVPVTDNKSNFVSIQGGLSEPRQVFPSQAPDFDEGA